MIGFRSPGFGITVWAETMNGSVYLAETCSNPRTADKKDFTPSVPEDLGKEASCLLLEEICRVWCYTISYLISVWVFLSIQ